MSFRRIQKGIRHVWTLRRVFWALWVALRPFCTLSARRLPSKPSTTAMQVLAAGPGGPVAARVRAVAEVEADGLAARVDPAFVERAISRISAAMRPAQ